MFEQKIKLLVLDDEPDVCDTVEVMFKRKGLEVYSVLNGEDAIKTFQERKPQIVLIDIKLGRSMDGISVLQNIKEASPFTCCIIITRIDDVTTQETAKSLGVDYYLIKPHAIDKLEGVVMREVERIRKTANP